MNPAQRTIVITTLALLSLTLVAPSAAADHLDEVDDFIHSMDNKAIKTLHGIVEPGAYCIPVDGYDSCW